jgi:hypothetical protein
MTGAPLTVYGFFEPRSINVSTFHTRRPLLASMAWR